jgi:hypothetical protein
MFQFLKRKHWDIDILIREMETNRPDGRGFVLTTN